LDRSAAPPLGRAPHQPRGADARQRAHQTVSSRAARLDRRGARVRALPFPFAFAFAFAFPLPFPFPSASAEEAQLAQKKPARDFLPVGALLTVDSHGVDGVQGGVGVELSYVHYFGWGDVFGDFGLGPVAQLQMVDANRVRGALGVEGNILFLG